jgi:hypothetical protein
MLGCWAQRNVPTVAGAACAVMAPFAWLGILLKGTMIGVTSIAWLRPLTLFTVFTAMAPLIGVKEAGNTGHTIPRTKCRRRTRPVNTAPILEIICRSGFLALQLVRPHVIVMSWTKSGSSC